MRLTVYRGGEIVVTAPQDINQNFVEQFIHRKSKWILDKIEYFKQFSGLILPKGGKREFLMLKNQALLLAVERIKYFNDVYKFKFNNISVKNQKTRWGSCSSIGNLNFNYKIASVPQRLSDYIIVHELCHLGEFNHSQKFWNLVARAIPDYLELKKELKRTGVSYY